MARILAIEDESNLRFAIRQALKKAGHEVAEADSVEPAWDLARQSDFDLILTDITLTSGNGIDLVGRLREDGYDGAIVVMTGNGTVESAVRAMKLGADDYLQKPLSLEELNLLVERLLEARKLRRKLKVFERLDDSQAGERQLLGQSRAWTQAMGVAERLAAMPIPATRSGGKGVGAALPTMLLLGETGTGKGVLARHIHDTAQKIAMTAGAGASTGPFVHINCSALPPTLVEAELFGHEKGAFTDAKGSREGLVEMSEGGTLFLDEIGDMPLDLQAKLLTVVEEGVFRRVGSSRDRYVRARIIAATNQDLQKRSDEGKFRRDLYYRLNAFTIRIPALREREGDAALLATDMLARFGRLYGRSDLRLNESARTAIARHDWPGNVRELINDVQHAAMLSESAEVGPADLGLAPAGRLVATSLLAPGAVPSPGATNGNGYTNGHGTNGHASGAARGDGTLVFDFENGVHKADEVERELILQALKRTRGNVSRAAKLIGMQRSSFRYRIERLGLDAYAQEIARQ